MPLSEETGAVTDPAIEPPAPPAAATETNGFTVADALKDEEFFKLAPEARIQILTRLDPEFGAMSAKDQASVVGKAHLRFLQSPEFAKQHPGSVGNTRGFSDHASNFGSTLASDVPGMIEGVYNAAKTIGGAAFGDKESIGKVREAAKGISDQSAEQRDIAKQRLKEGNLSEAAGHGLAAIPVIGPAAAQAGEDFRRGDYGTGAAHALELLAPSLLSRLLPKSGKLPLTIKNQLNPVEQTAMAETAPYVRQSAGQMSGSEPLMRKEQLMKNLPGSANRAQTFFKGQQQDIANRVADLAKDQSPVNAGTVETGEAARARLEQRITRLNNHADRMYSSARQDTANAQQTIQTGTTPSPGGLINPATNQPFQTPVFQTFDAPVNLPAQRAALQPIFDDITKLMPEAQQTYSKSFKALKNFMESTDTHMSAMDFDQFLGALKAITREGKSDMLTSRSQALAKQIINVGERNLNQALSAAGPDTANKLRIGRASVKGYYAADDFLNSLPSEPAAVYTKFVKGGDLAVDSLRAFQKVAPSETRIIGRTFLEGLVEKATAEGGFARADGVKAEFDRMGDVTKNLLLGPARAQQWNDILLGSKLMLRNLQKSGTTHSALAYGSMGVAGALAGGALEGLVTGNWVRAGELATTLGISAALVPNIMARVLFSETGAKILTGAMKVPVRTPAYRAAMTALGGKLIAFAKQDQQDKKAQAAPTEAAAAPAAPTPAVSPKAGDSQANYAQYAPIAEKAAEENGVPKNLFLWQIGQESGWNPAARNTSGRTLAIGIAQFQPATAKEYSVDPTNPEESIRAAAAYMRHLYDETGDWGEALQRYGTLNKDVPNSVWQAAARAVQASDEYR